MQLAAIVSTVVVIALAIVAAIGVAVDRSAD